MKRLLYIFGVPGVGKTTAVNAALGEPLYESETPIPHMVYHGGVQLDRRFGGIESDKGGTDTLAFDVISKVEAWTNSEEGPGVIKGNRVSVGKSTKSVNP